MILVFTFYLCSFTNPPVFSYVLPFSLLIFILTLLKMRKMTKTDTYNKINMCLGFLTNIRKFTSKRIHTTK